VGEEEEEACRWEYRRGFTTWLHWYLLRDMTHLFVSWLIYMCHDLSMWHDIMVSRMWHDVFRCAMTLSYVSRLIHTWHGVLVSLKWRDFVRYAMTHAYVSWFNTWNSALGSHLGFSYVTWLIQMCHDSFICVTYTLQGFKQTGLVVPLLALLLDIFARSGGRPTIAHLFTQLRERFWSYFGLVRVQVCVHMRESET